MKLAEVYVKDNFQNTFCFNGDIHGSRLCQYGVSYGRP